MAARAGQLGQPGIVAVDHLHARRLHALDELAHAGVAPGGVDMHLNDGGGRCLEAHGDGVEAEQDFGGRHFGGHQRIVATAISAPMSTG